MACSKFQLGYDDNRFEIVVSEIFHCPICLMVLKDPVMCNNEHTYCSFCIKKHLENSPSCPTCLQHLTVETLKPASRAVRDYISELNIKCDYQPRGCSEMVQVGHLKRHVEHCGFSPVQCSNEGCNALLNVRDKLHHEAQVCDFRKLKFHDCAQLKNEVKEMKVEMLAHQDHMKNEMKGMKEEMKGMKQEMKGMKQEMKGMIENEMKGMKEEMKGEIKNEVKEGVKEIINQVLVYQGQISNEVKSEVNNVRVEIKNEMKEMITNEMKGMKEEIKVEMKEIVMNAVRDAMTGIKDLEVEMKNSKQSSEATCSSDMKGNIFIVGGKHVKGTKYVRNKSTECFKWTTQTWSSLVTAVFEGCTSTSSFLYQDQMVVAGGYDDEVNETNSLKFLNVEDSAATWKDFGVNLPVKCSRHKGINCNDRLFISGGWVKTIGQLFSTHSNAIYEMRLVPPYSSKILTRLRKPRSSHGMEMFDQKLFILGGYEDKVTGSVIQYDLINNEFKEMTSLPYAVTKMATVLWQNNVLVIGGRDASNKVFNTVIMYDVITGRSQMLPCMKEKRCGCTAVLTGSVVVVMGGKNENYKYLKSVECFDLQRQVWQDLPDMIEPRALATAVVKPN